MIQAVAAATLALAPALVAGAHLGGASAPAMAPSMAESYEISGTDILNFALNLECLEADFYSWAVYGEGLSEELRGGGPESDGGMMANLMPLNMSNVYGAAQLARELAEDEVAHVAFLRAALGDAAVPCPKMDIGAAFVAAAYAAAGTELEPAFDPYANDLFFLHGAFIFEDVGVTAYNGAVPAATALLPPSVVQAAASILGTEAYHASAVRSLLLEAAYQAETPYGNVTDVVQLISDLRDSVDGPMDDDQGIMLNGSLNWVPADENALVYARSVPQVLDIVYLEAGAEMGGFYPEGINGVFGELTRAEVDEALAALSDKLAMMDDGMPMMPSMAMAPEMMCPPCPGGNGSGDGLTLYAQCGGIGYSGSTMCAPGGECVAMNDYFSQCRPVRAGEGQVELYGQCGGSGYSGATECASGSCVMMNEFYSQCLP